MAVDRKEANMKMLQDTVEVQNKTKDAVVRMNRQAVEAEQLGGRTLEELRRQGNQIDEISQQLSSVDRKLDQSKALQSKFDMWAGNWLGGKKRQALKEAEAEIRDRSQQDYSKIKEVFEHEKFDTFNRSWKKAGLVLCSDPSISCDDVFDPALQESLENSYWKVDFSLVNIDPDGWTYANSFQSLNKTGVGDSTPKWNSYVRRRKWKYTESRTGSAAVDDIYQRNEARKAKTAGSRQAEKLGYVPRNKTTGTLTANGMSSAGMVRKGEDQALDEESAAGLAYVKSADAEIDAGLESLSRTMDNLTGIAGAMKDESLAQNQKLDYLDSQMEKTMQKQTVVNARQRFLLK
eukprot:gene587-632_t